MSWSNPLPAATTISAGTGTAEKAFNALQAKFTDATNWATWAATFMEEQTTAITDALSTDVTSAQITSILNAIASAPAYSPGSLTFTNTPYSSTLLTDLTARLVADIATYSTGLGSTVESAIFDRAESRLNDERSAAYTELTTQLSSRGFEIPPGSLVAKQTEMTNELAKRMADVNADILKETALLAQQYNLEALKISTQLVQVLGQLNDSVMMRNFEIQKVSVMQAIDAYRAQLGLFEVKGGLVATAAKTAIESGLRSTQVEVEAFKGVAQAAAQMVASALNGINISGSYGFGSSEDTTKGTIGKSASVSYNVAMKTGDTVPELP